jgi:hypothetical protein
MSRYEWNELIKGWQNETLTCEQVIGQLLLWGQETTSQVQQLATTCATLRRHLEITESRLERLERRPPI